MPRFAALFVALLTAATCRAATHTVYWAAATGGAYYAFPSSQSLDDWTTYRVQLSEGVGANVGRYTGSLDDAHGTSWFLFSGATQPASWGASVGATTLVVKSNAVKIEDADATDVLGTAQTGDAYALLGTPVGASVSADIAAILDDTGTSGVKIATGETIELSDTELRTALGMSAADLDTQLEDIAAIAAAVDIDEASLTSAVWAYNSRTLTAGTNIVPRINMRPDPGFTFQVSRRADGTYKCTRPLRIAPGVVETIHPAIDLSPLFGQFNYVQSVGTPSISGGSLTVAAEGPRDTYAILEVDGTATGGEERTITVAVTMTSGASVQVKLDVEVFDE